MTIKLNLAAWGTLLTGLVLGGAEERPLTASDGSPLNVLLFVSDDQRPDTIAALGNASIRTPHLDRLVHEGTTVTRAVTAIPICVASRAELLTGRDGRTNGNNDFGFTPKAGAVRLAEALRDAGYETCYVGKWHTPGRPSTNGYVRSEGLYAGGGGSFPLTYPVDWKGMPVTGYRGWVFQTDDRQLFPEEGVGLTPNISEKFADAAIRFLETRTAGKPYFLHVNFTAPHDPLFVPAGYEGRYEGGQIPLPKSFLPQHPFDHGNFMGRDEVLFSFPRTEEQTRNALAVYYAVIEHLDAQVGRILDWLDRAGQLDATLVIYTSDHGLAMGSHGLRGKQNMYEHSVGVPLVLRGPQIPAGERLAVQCYLRDLYPTICDYAGVPIPESVQGKSLMPVIEGEQNSLYEAVYCHFRDVQEMICTGEWKYVRYPKAGREQLFHLPSDPDELTNLADAPQHQELKRQLLQRLDEWSRETSPP